MPPSRFHRVTRHAIAVLAVFLLTACSFGTRLAYNNLDWLTARWLDDYISFNDEQQQAFDAVFQQWWFWHRQTQLPLYAGTLRQLAIDAEDGLQMDELEWAQQQLNAYLRAAAEHSYRPLAQQLQQLSAEQLATLLKAYDADTAEYQDGTVQKTPEQRRERRLRRTRRALQARLGRLSTGQKQILEEWAAEREDLAPQWLESRRAWREAFVALMRARPVPDFAQRLRPLILEPEQRWSAALTAAVQRNAAARRRMLHAIVLQASPKQIRALQAELRRYAEICDDLAAKAPSAAGPH